jgi:hypothetical protein
MGTLGDWDACDSDGALEGDVVGGGELRSGELGRSEFESGA